MDDPMSNNQDPKKVDYVVENTPGIGATEFSMNNQKAEFFGGSSKPQEKPQIKEIPEIPIFETRINSETGKSKQVLTPWGERVLEWAVIASPGERWYPSELTERQIAILNGISSIVKKTIPLSDSRQDAAELGKRYGLKPTSLKLGIWNLAADREKYVKKEDSQNKSQP